EERLQQRVVGQQEAVTAVANAVRRNRAGLGDPNRPIGSFLFLGPTGVGKTELTKALAEFLFDSDNAMVRIDMSEFMEQHSVARLIGAPPGYVGYEEGGRLTEAVRRKPYSVILFHALSREQLTKIVDVQIDYLRRRLMTRQLKLEVSPEAKALLAEEGYDPQFGARPLKRVIQQRIENPLASSILRGEFTEGD